MRFCKFCRRRKLAREFYSRYRCCRRCWNKRSTAWRLRHPRKASTISSRYHMKRYGLTLEQYRALLKKQRGLCAICRKPERKRRRRLGVDHCHKTKRVRGLLCINCNRGIVLLDAGLLRRALAYVTRSK